MTRREEFMALKLTFFVSEHIHLFGKTKLYTVLDIKSFTQNNSSVVIFVLDTVCILLGIIFL